MIKRPTNNQLFGFTLIELLIVIGVIGILASSILIIINPLEQFARARDAARKQALRELASALERYMIKNGRYPISASFLSSEPGDVVPNNGGDWIPGLLASNEIKALSRDPKGGTTTNPFCGAGSAAKKAYLYITDALGSCYKLRSHCAAEAAGAYSPTDPFFDAIAPTWAWMVCDPQGSICCSSL